MSLQNRFPLLSPMRLAFATAFLLAGLLLAGCAEDAAGPDTEARAFSLLGGLERNELLTLSGSSAEEVFLPGGEAGASYLVVPFFASDDGTATLDLDVSGEGNTAPVLASTAAQTPPRRAAALATAREQLGLPAASRSQTAGSFHQRLRQWEQQRASPALRSTETQRRVQRLQRRTQASSPAAAVPTVGDTLSLRTINPQGQGSICENPLVRSARVEEVTEHAVIVTDTQNPAPISDDALASFAREFEDLVWPVDTNAFGEPSDLDGDERVTIFFTPVVNALDPPGGQSIVGGFFLAADLFASSEASDLPIAGTPCAVSNEREIFYIRAPDPDGAVGTATPVEDVVAGATGTIAHELQHLINASRRVYENGARELELTWLNEGLSHTAEELIFYAASGFSPGENISLDDLRNDQAGATAFLRFQVDNIINYFFYLEDPTAESLLGDDNLPTRGATWTFLRYAADQESGSDRDFFYDLANNTSAGVTNLNQVLDEYDALDLMQRWTVSAYTDDFTNGIPALYTQPSWNYRSLGSLFANSGLFGGGFPLAPQPLGGSASLDLTLQGGGAAFVRTDAGASVQARLATDANQSRALRVSVLRLE